jgi:hypothetical protein
VPVVFGALKMEIVNFRLAVVVFSALSVVRYIAQSAPNPLTGIPKPQKHYKKAT